MTINTSGDAHALSQLLFCHRRWNITQWLVFVCSVVFILMTEESSRFIPQTAGGRPSRRIVICCNPYNRDRATMLGVSRALWEASYSVFLFNFRSHSQTPTRQTIGHLERLDARAALHWVRSSSYKTEDARIALVGASMGGAIALMMAEEADDIVAVGTDCAFSTLREVVGHMLEVKIPMLTYVPGVRNGLLATICAVNKLFYGYDLAQVGPGAEENGQSCLKRLRCPLLLVHSEKDSVVPVSNALAIFNGAATPEHQKEVLVRPDVEHIGSYFRDEANYVKTFIRFLDKTFENLEKGGPRLATSENVPTMSRPEVSSPELVVDVAKKTDLENFPHAF